MKHIKRLFKFHDEYRLPPLDHPGDVTCEDCLKCKSIRHRKLGSTGCELTLMDVVVTDVAGPFQPCFTGEKRMVTFPDVSTSFSEICIIKHKSEVTQRLMNIVKRWEKDTGVKIKTIRSD